MKRKNSAKGVRHLAVVSIIAGSLTAMTPVDAAASDTFDFSLLGSGAQVRKALAGFGPSQIDGRSIAFGTDSKSGEGKCGEGKCGEGKCGDEGEDADKSAEGKCGEGKCG